MQRILRSHRCAVLHHGVVELVALGCASREEAALAHVVVEMLQTAIPTMRRLQEGKVTLNRTFYILHAIFLFSLAFSRSAIWWATGEPYYISKEVAMHETLQTVHYILAHDIWQKKRKFDKRLGGNNTINITRFLGWCYGYIAAYISFSWTTINVPTKHFLLSFNLISWIVANFWPASPLQIPLQKNDESAERGYT